MKTLKAQNLKLSQIVLNLEENNRDPERDYASIPSLQGDIRDNGQKDAILARAVKNAVTGTLEYHLLQGFRRTVAIMGVKSLGIDGLVDLYPEGYETTDANGKKVVRTFDTIYAEIVECSDEEAASLVADHGSVEPLSQVGIVRTIWRGLDHKRNEKDLVNANRGIIDQRNPIPAGKLKEMQEKVALRLASVKPDAPNFKTLKHEFEEAIYKDYRHGFMQGIMNAYALPTVAKQAYINRVRGDQNWPTDKVVADLKKVYEAEYLTDRTLNADNPGPMFLEAWDKIETAVREAAAEGKGPKPLGKMTGTEVDNFEKGLKSPLLKVVTGVIQRRIDASAAIMLDAFVSRLESKIEDGEERAIYNTLLDFLKAKPVNPSAQK